VFPENSTLFFLACHLWYDLCNIDIFFYRYAALLACTTLPHCHIGPAYHPSPTPMPLHRCLYRSLHLHHTATPELHCAAYHTGTTPELASTTLPHRSSTVPRTTPELAAVRTRHTLPKVYTGYTAGKLAASY